MMPWQQNDKGGRPVKLKSLVPMRTNTEASGFKMPSTEADVVKQVRDQYISKQELPAPLAPRHLTVPTVIAKAGNRKNSASHGRRALGKVN